MAGENSMPVLQYQDDFVVETITLPAIVPVLGFPILYADRDIVIDSITVGVMAPSTGTATAMIFQKTTSGVRLASDNSKITAAVPTDALTTIMGGGYASISAASTTQLTTETTTNYLSSTANRLDVGNWLVAFTGTIAAPTTGVATAAMTCAVQIRYRSRQK